MNFTFSACTFWPLEKRTVAFSIIKHHPTVAARFATVILVVVGFATLVAPDCYGESTCLTHTLTIIMILLNGNVWLLSFTGYKCLRL